MAGSHRIYIGVGSNIERTRHINRGVAGLYPVFDDIRVSRVFESEPVGFSGHAFFNLVVEASTDKSIAEVCQALKAIERENGRTPGEKRFAPRTLDLDLLLYDDVIAETPVELPRDEIVFNAFVLWPLAEMAPDLVHPVTGKRIALMWQEYDKNTQALHPVEFTWSVEE